VSEREAARELIRELLAEALAPPNGNGHGADGAGGGGGDAQGRVGGAHGAAPAVYPPPPVAAVHRPSTWAGPAAEPVTLRTDADLERFVLALLARCEDPRQRDAIRAGRVRFTLGGTAPAPARGTAPAPARGTAPATARGAAAAPAPAGVLHIARGAVTERTVDEAARTGARLMLGPRAVLTPLAREKARAKGIAIERER
jgi:hypothetical protein